MTTTIDKRKLVLEHGRWPYEALKKHVRAALAKSPFASPVVWPAACVVLDDADFDALRPPTARVISRTELAEEFRAADLPKELARVALERRVGHGRVLLWVVTDDDVLGSASDFGVLDLIGRPVSRC